MSSDILLAGITLPMSKYAEDDKNWGDIVTSSLFLPRIQIFSGTSELVQTRKIDIGHCALVRRKDQVEDLSTQFDCMPLSMRYRATFFGGENKIFSYYNPKSPEFKAVMDRAAAGQGKTNVFGPEFLIWVPQAKSFSTFHFNNISARLEASNMRTLMVEKKAATVKASFMKNSKGSWYGPVIVPCSTPFELPSTDEMLQQAERFSNPKETEVEVAEVVTSDRVV